MKLLYFAWMREHIGLGEEEVTPPEGVKNVGDLISWLRDRGPGYEAAFSDERLIRCAVNQKLAGLIVKLDAKDEVAFFPPMTGG